MVGVTMRQPSQGEVEELAVSQRIGWWGPVADIVPCVLNGIQEKAPERSCGQREIASDVVILTLAPNFLRHRIDREFEAVGWAMSKF